MNANASHIPHREDAVCSIPSDLSIALISPNEKRRAAAAESACNFFEFAAYLATPADLEKLSQMRYDLILVDIDGDTEKALNLVERLSSQNGNRVLVYSSEKGLEKLTRCMRAGARDFLGFPFQRDEMTQALTRIVAPRASTCARREQPEPRKFAINSESFWRGPLERGGVTESQARP